MNISHHASMVIWTLVIVSITLGTNAVLIQRREGLPQINPKLSNTRTRYHIQPNPQQNKNPSKITHNTQNPSNQFLQSPNETIQPFKGEYNLVIDLNQNLEVTPKSLNSTLPQKNQNIQTPQASNQTKATQNQETLISQDQTENKIIDPIISANQQLQTYQNKIIQNNKFPGIILEHQLPLKFYQKEIFQIRGKLKDSSHTKNIYLNFVLRNMKSGQRYSYSHCLKPLTSQFSFKIKFGNLKGKFYLAFFAGSNGTISKQIYQILQEPFQEIPLKQKNIEMQTNITPSKPSGLEIFFKNNKVGFSWDSNIFHPLNKLTLTQGSQKVSYFLSNFQTSFQIDQADFFSFKPGQVQVTLKAAFSKSIGFIDRTSNFSQKSTLKFEGCYHYFIEQDFNFLALNDLKPKIDQNEVFQIKGVALRNVQNKFWIQTTNKTFIIGYLNGDNKSLKLNAGYQIDKIFSFSQQGVYIFEINKPQGGAALNLPIYVGKAYPILPDLSDLLQKQFQWRAKIEKRSQSKIEHNEVVRLLNLVNEKRRQYGVDPVLLDERLNRLAMSHSQDMVSNNYFNHVNLRKQNPQERALSAGIKLRTGQNIAMSQNLVQAHFKLCRSPIHLYNIVSPEWQYVGFGIALNSMGLYYVTQQFSTRNLLTEPLTVDQYTRHKKNLLSGILEENPELQGENQELSQIMEKQLMAKFTPLDQLGFKLTSFGYKKFSIGNFKALYSKNFSQKFRGKNYFKHNLSGYKSIGIAFLCTQQEYLTISIVFF